MRRSLFLFPFVALLSLTPLRPAGGLGDSTGVTTRVSVRTGGGQADAQVPAGAGQPAVSDTLGVVAFVSDATNLVPDDRNGVSDVFVRQNGVVSRVSLGPNFAEANGPSSSPSLSRDGQYVAFTSAADNLVPGDTNGALDVFVYDRASSTVTRVSVAGDGLQADGDSRSPSISDTAGPLVVAFTSVATNLAAGDGNGQSDVFVRTLSSPPSTTLVSVAAGRAAAGNDGSDEPSLDGSGTKVAFSSDATDLVDGDTNGKTDVFWRDLTAGVTERVSLRDRSTTQGADDSFSPSISGDGTRIAFASDASNLTGQSDDNDTTDVFLRDRSDVDDQRTTFLSKCGSNVGDDQSFAPRITGDVAAGGSGVAYVSHAGNLLGGCGDPSAPPDNNNEADVYFWPFQGGQNERISRDPAGAQFPRPSLQAAVSGDGRLVAFTTGAADPATGEPGPGSEVFGRDRSVTPGVTTRLSAPTNGAALGPAVTEFPALSGDGKVVVYASAASDLVSDDNNGLLDVFVSDRSRNETTRVTVGLGGAQPDGPSAADSAPAVSADGRIVAFSSEATNLVSGDTNGLPDVFVYDRVKKETTRVSVGPDGIEAAGGQQGAGSYMPSLSADGRFVAFASDADNLVAGDTNNATDVFVHDRQTKTTTRVSVGQGGMAGDDSSSAPSINADGTVVAFLSEAQNLAPGDTNGEADVFLRDLKPATTTVVSARGGKTGNGASSAPALSADGQSVAFASAAGDLVDDDTNNTADIFVADRRSGTVERVSVGPDGAPGNRASDGPSISADGRFVAFSSEASTLVPEDTNQRGDIFVRDRTIAETSRVSLGVSGPGSCAGPVQADRSTLHPALSADGRVVAFQSAATNLVAGDTNSAPDIFVHDRRPVRGYWLVASDGGLFNFGSACFAGSAGATNLTRPIVGMAASPTGRGYWLVASDGGVFGFGDAGFYGSTGALKLAKPIVGMAATRTGKGYWLVASDGGIFAFGDAKFFGSTGGVKLAQPVVGMAATPTGKGYWLAARDGGIFTFGDAAFSGSTGGIPLAQPIVGMSATPAGGGYWLVGSDGGIFSFGNAAFFGSTGATKLNRPIVGLSPSPSGGGYWLVASDGGIFAFGDATFSGSTGATKLVQPIVGMAARP